MKLTLFLFALLSFLSCNKEEDIAPAPTDCKTCYLEIREETVPNSGIKFYISKVEYWCDGTWRANDGTTFDVTYSASGVTYYRNYRWYCK